MLHTVNVMANDHYVQENNQPSLVVTQTNNYRSRINDRHVAAKLLFQSNLDGRLMGIAQYSFENHNIYAARLSSSRKSIFFFLIIFEPNECTNCFVTTDDICIVWFWINRSATCFVCFMVGNEWETRLNEECLRVEIDWMEWNGWKQTQTYRVQIRRIECVTQWHNGQKLLAIRCNMRDAERIFVITIDTIQVNTKSIKWWITNAQRSTKAPIVIFWDVFGINFVRLDDFAECNWCKLVLNVTPTTTTMVVARARVFIFRNVVNSDRRPIGF